VQFSAANKNIGDLLTAKGVTWGFFQGGFKPTATTPDGTAVCGATHNIGAVLGGTGTSGAQPYGTKPDYIPHHEPFQYYPSTANPHHRPPSSTEMIGRTDPANHQYDLSDFWAAADAGNLPAVSYLKAAAYQDEFRRPHPDRSNLDTAVHRRQLAYRAHRRPLVRRARGSPGRDVRLRRTHGAAVDPQPRQRQPRVRKAFTARGPDCHGRDARVCAAARGGLGVAIRELAADAVTAAGAR
jgi:Phosphoesterase family